MIEKKKASALFVVAGIPPSKLVEAHGTFATAQCLKCEKSIPARMVKVCPPSVDVFRLLISLSLRKITTFLIEAYRIVFESNYP